MFCSDCWDGSEGVPAPRSVGVIGPAECGVNPGGWAMYFCRTSRIFSCSCCLFWKMSLWASWKLLVAWDDGNMPCSWNSCITRLRRCSRIFRWPFSSAELTDRADGVLGVRGDRSALSAAISTTEKKPLYCSMLKSGPKNRLPIMYELEGVAVVDSGALLSEVSGGGGGGGACCCC